MKRRGVRDEPRRAARCRTVQAMSKLGDNERMRRTAHALVRWNPIMSRAHALLRSYPIMARAHAQCDEFMRIIDFHV